MDDMDAMDRNRRNTHSRERKKVKGVGKGEKEGLNICNRQQGQKGQGGLMTSEWPLTVGCLGAGL